MDLRRTPFYAHHQAAGARLIDFGGWELPVQYAGILAEHQAVRTGVGLFDVSHMGEVRVRGPRALDAIRHLVTNNIDIVDGQAQYSPMCQPDGGIVDDLIVYRISSDNLLICVNAANREKDFAWMVAHNPYPEDAVFTDEGNEWAQVAIQGPRAEAVLQQLTATELAAIRYYWFAQGTVAGVEGCIIARTGYTGEDGFEVFLPLTGADAIWTGIMEKGAPLGLVPVGLGARDTLRLEASMCLYGNDIDATTTPVQAKLGWTIGWDKADFIGKSVMVVERAAGPARRLVGLVVEGRIGRSHNPILSDGVEVGQITSGTRSPTLEHNIALGYVRADLARLGTRLQVDVRGKIAEATVVRTPFYKRAT